MNETSRPATWEDVVHVVRLLQAHGVRFVLVGGYALAAHGYVRATVDIDIGVSPDTDNSRRWILALSELPDGVARELMGEDDPFEGDYAHAIRINDAITIDVMPSVSGLRYEELLPHVALLQFDDVEIPVLDLEGLYKTKKHSLRPKDQEDVRILELAMQRMGLFQNTPQ